MDGAFPSARPYGSDGPDVPRRGFRGTAENAKTRLCQRWANGECRFGDRCNFAHGEHELRTLPPRADAGGYGRGGGPGGFNGPPRGGGFGGRGWDDGYRGGGGFDGPGGGYGGPPGGGYGGPPGGAGGYGGGPMGGGYGRGGPAPAGGPGGYGAPAAGGYGGPPRGADPAGRGGEGYGAPRPAAASFPVQGPNGWVAYKTQDTGEIYYHNHTSQVTTWDRPLDWPGAP